MKEFVEYIVKNLVDNPDKVQVTQIAGSHTIILELRADAADVGKVVGKHGKTINSIRTLLMSVAARGGVRVNLELIDESGRGRREPREGEEGGRPPREEGGRGGRDEGGRGRRDNRDDRNRGPRREHRDDAGPREPRSEEQGPESYDRPAREEPAHEITD